MAAKKKSATRALSSWDELDAAGIGIGYQPMSFADEPAVVSAPEKQTFARRIGDTAVQFGQGAVTGVKMMSDIFGANNAVSSGLSDVNQALDGLLSATAQGDKQKVAQIMQEAEGKGWGEQVIAGLKAAGVDPVGLAVNALGTSLPTMATMLIPGAGPAAVAARMGAGMAMGAGQGVGAVKGQIYDETKRKWLESGATPDQAEARAQEASAYGGENTDQMAIGGVLGMGSVLGAERALGKVLHGAGKAGPGMLGRVATTTAAETGTEMMQGGQEKFATNTALNRQGFDVDPMSGVIANATLEGAAAAPMGALAGIPKPAINPAKQAADAIRATESVQESGALTRAVNAGVEAKAQAVEAGAPVEPPPGAAQTAEAAPDAVDDPVRDQILALPDGARQDALRAYAVVNRTDVAKGVQQYNRKLLDRLLAQNQPAPVLGERLTGTDMGTMLGGGGMAGNTDPLMGALGMGREAQANSITNVANVAERRPPMPASDAVRMLDEARNQGVELAVAEHPAGGFVLVPPNWVTPDMAAQGEARLNETIARMQQADAAPVERAPRTRTEPVDLSLSTDPVQNYMDTLRTVNTPAARAYVRDFDAGRITPADVQQRMAAEKGKTPDQRIAKAAAEAPAQTDPVADRLARAAAQGIATPAPTDILNPAGEPFKTRMAADRAAKQTPGAVVPVEGGFVVRQQEPVNVQDVPQTPEVPQAAPAISQPGQAPQAVGAQPAGPAAVSTARPGAVEAAGAAPFPATTGVNREPSPTQAIQASAQPAQTGPAPAASDAGPGAQGGAAAPAPVGSGEPAAGLTNAATPQNNGAQAAPATGTQAQAPGNANWAALTPEQRRRARLEHEIATGQTNNGGVVAGLRPSAIEKRKQELAAMGDAGKLPSPGPAEPLSADGLAAQGQAAPGAQAAQAGVAPRPKNWRTSMLGATPVAKAMGIDTKGKRLAQVVAEIDARDTQAPATPAPAPTPGPTRLGRDNTPLSEGGKPFKTRKAAGDAKKLQPMMRVVTVPGGYALAEKTPAQLAAEERAAKRLRTPRTSPAGEPVPAHAFIAASGGLHMRHRNDLGVDGNPRIGNRRLFGGLNRGLSIEQATEMLVADGYLSEGASHNDAYALIKKSLSQPQYNADGIERIAQAESDAQFEDYMAAQEEAAADGDTDPFGMADEFTAEELDEVGYTAADPALQAEVSALIAQADAMDIDTYAILEDIARTYANATQDQYNAAARDAIAAAIARSNQDGGSVAAQAAPAAEPAAEQELNRPEAPANQAQAATENVAPEALELAAQTPAEAAARQDAQEQADKAEAAAKRAEDAAAKAEEERKRIAQASVRAADRFELGQDPMDSLTGQGSMFDDAPAQQAPTTAVVDDDGRERFTLSIEMFGDVPYRASKPVDAGNGDVVSSRVITTKTKLTAANAQSLGLPKDKGTVYAWRVSVIRRADGAAHSVIEAMATDNGRSPDGEVLAHFKEVENPEAMERIAPAIANAALSDWRAAQPQQAPTTTEAVAQPITRADVTAAQQQAAAIITERIDAMTAGEVNTIARRFLPTMGVRPTVSKERNKAAVTDFTKVNPLAAADEFGATLPADVRRVLQADMEGTAADGLAAAKQGLAAAKQEPGKPIEDAGEKIGGARKDRWKERGLNLDDLDAMTEAEGAELATKANVWKPDYEAMSEASEPVTAAMVKTIYDQLAAKPKKNTPEGRRQYVQMMRIVRDVLTEADGPEAVKNAYQEIRKRAGLNTLDPKVKADGRELLFSVYKGRSDPFVFGFNELQRAKKLVEDGFPAKAAPWKSRLSVGRREGGNGTTERGIEMYMELSAEVGTPLTREQILGGFYRVSTKDNKTVAFAASKADAEAAAATVYERDMKGKKDGKPEPVRPNLDELKRENLPQRIDRDVTSEDFVRDLGFRGVEFGLWSAQDERQRILNMAYDGLMDLAEIMGVPPKAMSLNGTLGMAFGARGGGRFAAHYEPGKLVINMTKIRGGGSMAHEWAHAMDHYFGELGKADAYTTQARGASGWYSEDQYIGVPRKRMERVGNEWKSVEKMRLDNLRPEMAAAFDEVMRALFKTQVTKAEMVRSHELDLERTQALARNEQDAELKAMYQNMATNKRQALDELRKDPDDKMYTGRGRTDYANQAQALSGKSVDGYWVRPTEMFARAFESWVFDKVTAMGARSDYLVHGVEEDRFAGGAYKGNPYPTGEERARINAAFDKLAGTIKTKETENGVALFSRAQAIQPAESNARLAAAQQLAGEIAAKWASAPEIIVARNMQDDQIPQRVRDHDATLKSQGATGEARGFIYKGKVYLLADQLKGPQQISETLFHEALGHHGLRGVFGDGLTPILKQIAALRKADVQAKADEYGLDMAIEKQRLDAAEEVLAELAQSRPEIGFVKRAVAAIRTWLRANVPGFKELALTDAEIVRSYILPARGFVERGRVASGAVVGSLEPAFSLANGNMRAGGLAPMSPSPAKTPLYEAFRQLARFGDAFQLRGSNATELADIAQDMQEGVTQAAKFTAGPSTALHRGTRKKTLALYTDGLDGEQHKLLDIFEADSGRPFVVIGNSDVGQDKGGAKAYQIAFAWAHNNGKTMRPDPAGLTVINRLRRSEAMISSALRFGTTRHLEPHADQYIALAPTTRRLGAEPEDTHFSGNPQLHDELEAVKEKLWTPGDGAATIATNVQHLIEASAQIARMREPALRDLEVVGGTLRNRRLESSVPLGDLDAGAQDATRSLAGVALQPSRTGVGRTTAIRYAITASVARAVSDGPGASTGADRQERGGRGPGDAAAVRAIGQTLGRLDRGTPAGLSGVLYSRTDSGGASMADAAGAAIKAISATNIKKRAGFKLTDYLGVGLQALGRRQIVDIYGDMLPLAEYNRLVQQMEADKNEGGAEADQLVTQWAKLPDEGKLADLMHDATLAQIDPAAEFVDGDDKAQYLSLQRKYNLLSDEAKKVYADTRDAYKAHHAKVRSAIKERIERSEIKGERKAALLKQMDDEFFKAVKGVYFPLARFGQYAVTVKGPDGKVESVSRAETKAEAEALRNNLLSAFPRDKGFTVGRVMLSKDFVADRDAVGRGFMTELYQVLDKQDMDAVQRAELEDTLGQLYLSSLPDLSWAKHGIHRKGTPGFSQDARRAFAQNMFHGARYLAKLRYSDLMQDELSAMQKHVDDWREVEDFDQNSAQRVVDEMNKRHESLMNPKSNALSTALTSLGFVFHLGLSPASAMVNLSQTALVAYPIMGAKWGFGKASAALLKASAEAAKGKNDITASLNDDERAAYDEAVRAGTIDVTMAHDLAGIAQGEDAGVMWKIRPAMRLASSLFHHAERFNRQVTFVAAYRLAREAGADHHAAFEQATKATYDGHFDYGAANRPRFMQGNVAKVLLLFKQYGQNMVYTLARNAQQSIKGESPEVRAQARKALGGLLAMHAAAAGVLGLPMVTTLLAAASMIGGDDDEPWDAKVALQNMLADTFGQKPAEVLAHGLSRLTPWDISGRVGLDRLIFPDVQEGLEGQRLWESAATQALGPVGGIFGGALKGLDLMSDGHYQLGLEAMLPAVLRQGVKSIRYGMDGAHDKSGVSIKDEVSTPAVVGQLLGFSPSEVRLAQEGKSAVYQQDRALGERRQELLTKAARATMAKDAEARAEAMKEIEHFNQKNPTRRITPLNVLQSVRNRQKRIDQADGGVYLPKNRRDAIEAGRFAVTG